MTRLQHPLHLPGAQLLLADLAHVLEADTKPLGQLPQRYPAALVGLQYPAPQIIRKSSGHALLSRRSQAQTTYPKSLHLGITTREPL